MHTVWGVGRNGYDVIGPQIETLIMQFSFRVQNFCLDLFISPSVLEMPAFNILMYYACICVRVY